MRAPALRRLVGAAALAAALAPAAASDAVPEPSAYRSAPYRAPVPATLAGTSVLTTDDAEAAWHGGEAVFVDVLPRPERPANLPEGTLWRAPPRANIPGSVWLPNTGYDRLSDDRAAYFEAGLSSATGGQLGTPLIIYCLADCWMSWNAAKRAVALGYRDVRWYPDGTDGWAEAMLPLEPSEPMEPDAR